MSPDNLKQTSAPPVSFRPDAKERQLLEAERKAGVSHSEVLKHGLNLYAKAFPSSDKSTLPFHPYLVDDPRVIEVVESAVSAACEVLDEFTRTLGVKYPEVNGIGTNFQGLLIAHLKAMVTGAEHAKISHAIPLLPLFATKKSFGTVPFSKKLQGYTFMRIPETVSEPELFFNGTASWVPLQSLDPGELFTSDEFAVKSVLKLFRTEQKSPRDCPMRLVLIDFSGPELVLVGSN